MPGVTLPRYAPRLCLDGAVVRLVVVLNELVPILHQSSTRVGGFVLAHDVAHCSIKPLDDDILGVLFLARLVYGSVMVQTLVGVTT